MTEKPRRTGAGRPRRRRRKPCGDPDADRDLRRARDILERIDGLGRELLRRELAGQAPVNPAGTLPLELSVHLDRADGLAARAEALLEHLRARIQEVGDGVAALRPGRVYCYWCKGNACDHGLPSTPRQVFIGYEPTGRPRFADFADLVLARQDPRIEGIYKDPPEPIAVYDGGSVLRAEQLPVFGGRSASFRIVGQVALGYLPFPSRERGVREVFAVTFQAVEARRGDGGTLLDLNVVGRTPSGALEQWIDAAFDGAVLRAVREARRRIREVGRGPRGRGRAADLEDSVRRHLNGLARTLERFHRQGTRRTQHAQDRRRQGDRPTRKAVEDARRAPAEALFWDDKHDTYVVVGSRGRTHVFSRAGVHVTSIRASRESIERKQNLKLWRPLRPPEEGAFRKALGAGPGERPAPSSDDDAGRD